MAGKRKVRPFEPIDKEQKLQEHFKTIRMATGMTTVEFADKIGVTRQLVNFIEGGKVNLSYTVYLGVEGLVLNLSPKNGFLADLWDVLVDRGNATWPGAYRDEIVDLYARWGLIISAALSTGVITVSQAEEALNAAIND